MPLSPLAYCVVNIVSAAFEEAYSGTPTCDSDRPGSWVRAREPMPLLTLTITGSSERRSSGRNAVVARTTPMTSRAPGHALLLGRPQGRPSLPPGSGRAALATPRRMSTEALTVFLVQSMV